MTVAFFQGAIAACLGLPAWWNPYAWLAWAGADWAAGYSSVHPEAAAVPPRLVPAGYLRVVK